MFTNYVRYLVLGVLFSCFGRGATAQTIWYVNDDAPTPGANNGTSWFDAFRDLQDAIDVAAAGDRIWVAAGTYRPSERTTPSDPRSATFSMPDAHLYGGFAGLETDLEQRDWVLNETILSGDLHGDDILETPSTCCSPHGGPGCDDAACEIDVCSIRPTCCAGDWDYACAAAAITECGFCSGLINGADNSYHVVTAIGRGQEAVLDGFIITRGNANQQSGEEDAGGGLRVFIASVVIRNCAFSRNFAVSIGGAAAVEFSSPIFDHCQFAGNFTQGNGGAIFIVGNDSLGISEPRFQSCRFTGNIGIGAGAVYAAGGHAPVLVDCDFDGNRAALVSGAIASAEGMNESATIVNTRFRANSAGAFAGALGTGATGGVSASNTVFTGNSANRGGAIVTGGGLAVTNSTIAANHALSLGGGLYGEFASPTLANTIWWANTDGSGDPATAQVYMNSGQAVVIDYSCVQDLPGGFVGDGNIAADPLLVDPDGVDDVPGTADDDVRLRRESPCIDAANNFAVPADAADVDVDGDLVEPLPLDAAGFARFVDHVEAPDTGLGAAPIVDIGALEFFVPDCNDNDVPDDEDIAAGTSEDCNHNLVPDECEDTQCVVFSFPPDGSVDARNPFDAQGNLVGWDMVTLTFNNDPSPLSPGAFRVTTNPPVPPPIVHAVEINGLIVTLTLESHIPPAVWTTFIHRLSGTSTRIGYLPGDVDADRTSSPRDILALIDSINGVTPLPDWATDVNRSGATTPEDVLALIDVLNSCNPQCWNYATLPPD